MLVSTAVLFTSILGYASTTTLKLNRKDSEIVRSIVSEYIRNSANPKPFEEQSKIFKWAETVFVCRKFLGAKSRIKRYRKSFNDEAAVDYQYENNTESENNIPKWPISPSKLDEVFDSARFDRCLKSMNDPSFERRITWLYPTDGKRKSSNSNSFI